MDNRKACYQWNVYLVKLGDNNYSEQCGVRPCVCVSNNLNNLNSTMAQFIPLTSRKKTNLPIHFILSKDEYKFLFNDSIGLTEQLTCKSVNNVIKFLGKLHTNDIFCIKECIKIQFGLLE